MFQYKEYFTQVPDIIPFIRPDKGDRPDSCDRCAGYCYKNGQGTLQVGSQNNCNLSTDQTLQTLLPKIENTYIVITPSNISSYYLDFLSPGVAKNSVVFLRQQSVETPMKWTLEAISDSSVYIRTYEPPYYYLFANCNGTVGVSLFRGNNNQKWMILQGYIIANVQNRGYLSFNGTSVALSQNPITNWDINIA